MERYDPGRGIPFRYYCTRRITGSIIDGIGRSREVNAQIAVRRRIERERLRSVRGDGPAPETLDEKLTLIGDVAAELAIGLMLEDSAMVLTDERDPLPDAYETLAWKQAAQRLVSTLETLPQRERSVIRHHYIDGMPFEQIARLLGLSKGRISQIHKSGIVLLRKRLSDLAHFHLQR